MWSEVIALFQEYMGTGLIVIWFLVSLIYLWVNETRKYIRILFVYTPVVLLLLYFNPLFAALVYGAAGNEIYYRILWLLPITIVIAYTCVHIYGKLKGMKQGVFAVVMVVVLAFSGSYVYGNPFFARAENSYHVPDSVVAVCDAIVVPGREVRAVFPKEFLQYVRQYAPTVCMPYGREVLAMPWYYEIPLYAAMEEKVADWNELAPLVLEASCHYVILPADKETVGEPTEFGLLWFGQVDDFAIYRNTNMELVIPDMSGK